MNIITKLRLEMHDTAGIIKQYEKEPNEEHEAVMREKLKQLDDYIDFMQKKRTKPLTSIEHED